MDYEQDFNGISVNIKQIDWVKEKRSVRIKFGVKKNKDKLKIKTKRNDDIKQFMRVKIDNIEYSLNDNCRSELRTFLKSILDNEVNDEYKYTE